MCVVNMCQQGRKYHTSLAMSAADGLFACCECAFKVWVCEWYKIGQCECAFSNARVGARPCLCVCVRVLLRQLADLACHTRCFLVNKSLKMIDYGGLFLMNPVLFVCGTQGSEQHDAPIFSATYGETPWHITTIHIP